MSLTESQFPLISKMRVSSLRYTLRNNSNAEMPHIPEDIYLNILAILEKDYKVAVAKKALLGNDMDIEECREYDLPYRQNIYMNAWKNRKYGLPDIIYAWDLAFINKGDTTWCYDCEKGTVSRFKQGEPTIVEKIDGSNDIQIDF
jgi:hypothetical protein